MTALLAAPQTDDGAPLSARVPKYYVLKRALLEMTEQLPPGSPVPPERTLALTFDTSRTTVRQALQELVIEGRLTRIQGKGGFKLVRASQEQLLHFVWVYAVVPGVDSISPPREPAPEVLSPKTVCRYSHLRPRQGRRRALLRRFSPSA